MGLEQRLQRLEQCLGSPRMHVIQKWLSEPVEDALVRYSHRDQIGPDDLLVYVIRFGGSPPTKTEEQHT